MMSPHAHEGDEPTWRTWSWVSHKTFAPLSFYRQAWQLLKRDWLVFVWTIAADLLGRLVTATAGLLLLALVALNYHFALARGDSPWRWVEHLASTLRSPTFIIGMTGLAFFAALLATALEALATGGLWGILRRRLRDEPVEPVKTFWADALTYFPPVLSLLMLRLAFRLITGLLLASLMIAYLHAQTSGAYAQAPVLLKALLIGGALTFFILWAGLTRFVFHVSGAPLIMDGLDLGEAIFRGSYFTVDNFISLYRLLIFALALLMIPLAIYWGVLMVNNLTLIWPQLSPLTLALRLAGEVFLWASISLVGVAFYGALFAFYSHDDQAYQSSGDGSPPGEPTPATEAPLFERGATIDDFLPDESPHRFALDDIVPDLPSPTDEDPERGLDDPVDPDDPRDDH